MNKQDTLEALNVLMANSCACALRNTATQAVPGEGNPDADILFIGEAPGKKEDSEGRPFIGAAGTLLTKMLATLNLKRADIYITNIVKYRPPNNRDPLPEEIIACEQWLHEEIKIIRPKLIITLGRHAMEHFVPGEKISHRHGQVFHRTLTDIGEQTFLILYHPAAALYNGNLRHTIIQDLKKIAQFIDNTNEKNKGKQKSAKTTIVGLA